MSRTLNIDFYKLTLTEDSNIFFEVILQKVMTVSSDQRFEEVRLHPVFLHNKSLDMVA
jgi:hypothetical protein